MIINVKNFIQKESSIWSELENILNYISENPEKKLTISQILRLNYLYSKVSDDLVRISTLSSEEELKNYLQSLVARTYSVIYSNSGKQSYISLTNLLLVTLKWFFITFPTAFRRNIKSFYISTAITAAGVIFGLMTVAFNQDAKKAILPAMFSNHMQTPTQRIEKEMEDKGKHLLGVKNRFAASLIKNNVSVAFMAMAFGILWGIGTVIILFYNGVILGGIAIDYIFAGHSDFLLAWLLPHGVIEIPAIIIAGQAGLLIAGCIISPGQYSRISKLKATIPDIASLIGGVVVLLIWAGIVEAFISQYHEPVIPYLYKILFGICEFAGLLLLLYKPWRKHTVKDS
jgi:uncharacterized membrane protein SpoIIM required for sporulation